LRGAALLRHCEERKRRSNPAFAVIARSEATKQSILSLRGTMDCFAALAMTEWHGLLAAEPVIERAFARPVGIAGSTLHRVRDTRNVLSPLSSDLPVGPFVDGRVESYF
jgi:hypothetical protein